MNHISLLQGDITQAAVDAIVNAANPKMLGGGGVDGAIHRAAGPELLEECRKIKPVDGVRCPFGQARITPAGNLKARYVIHAVGPIYRNENDPEGVLFSTYQNSLSLAVHNHCRSIAFPAISCGAYGFPIESAADIALGVCDEPQHRNLNIYFYLFDQATLSSWRTAYDSRLRCQGANED